MEEKEKSKEGLCQLPSMQAKKLHVKDEFGNFVSAIVKVLSDGHIL